MKRRASTVSSSHLGRCCGHVRREWLGKRWDMGRDRFLQPYVKAGVNYEFLGDCKVSVNGRPFRDDVRGLRAYYGVGADWQLNRRVRFYGEFEREEGDYVSTPWSVNVGVRIAF